MAISMLTFATTLLLCIPFWFLPWCHLNLSSLIKEGQFHIAQRQSRHGIQGVESYSGYLTVDERYDSNMFFWFFPAENKPDAPVLLWLNGGPGRSSMYGALLENGPLALNEQGRLERRKVSWTKSFSMLYVDNPVGVGYSYTTNDEGFSKTTEDISRNLYSVLVQFFKMFPGYAKNSFYVGGQSYACKFAFPLGRYIHDRNNDLSDRPEVDINLKGLYMGGGFCDPVNMYPAFYDFFFNFGVITYNNREDRRDIASEMVKGIWMTTPEGDILTKRRIEVLAPKLDSYDNILGAEATNTRMQTVLDDFLARCETRVLLRAGFVQKDQRKQWDKAVININDNFLASTSSDNAFLMEHYKVLHFSGNLDVAVSVPMVEAFLQHVQWSSREHFLNSSRELWYLNGELAGWYTTAGNLNRVIVRNAGHIVPYDQPERALAMMERFVAGEFVM